MKHLFSAIVAFLLLAFFANPKDFMKQKEFENCQEAFNERLIFEGVKPSDSIIKERNEAKEDLYNALDSLRSNVNYIRNRNLEYKEIINNR